MAHRRLAIIQGGINRTWLAACHADFEPYMKRWAKARASFDDLPDNIKKGDELGFYGRLTRLSVKRTKTATRMTAVVHPLHIREVQRDGETILRY